MSLVSITTNVPGMTGVVPSIIYIHTTDPIATVTTAGYLDPYILSQGLNLSNTQLALIYTVEVGGAININWYQVSINVSTKEITLVIIAQDGVVVGPVAANRIATFVNAGGAITDSAVTAVHGASIQAGLSGTAGTLISFPAAAAQGSLIIAAVGNAGNFNSTISSIAGLGQASVYTLPDPGSATANFIINKSAGTQTISTGNLTVAAGNLTAGSVAPALGTLVLFPAASGGANDKLIISPLTTGGNFGLTIRNSAMGQSSVVSVPDPGAATANFLLDAGAANAVTDYQQMIPLSSFLVEAGGGTFVLTRNAQGNWSQLKNAADDTSIIALDVTAQLRAAANKGFKLTSFDVIYQITIAAMDAHTVTLASTVYANNAAVSVTNNAVTGALATATQANPYLTNVTVDVPAFTNPAANTSVKQVIEITANAALTTVYAFYGVNLRFTKTIS